MTALSQCEQRRRRRFVSKLRHPSATDEFRVAMIQQAIDEGWGWELYYDLRQLA